jgi:hypothetical protein
VLLQAWNCFTASDGVSKMKNDPNTVCTSAEHIQFQRMALALIIIVGPGVPICSALWLRRLKRVAKNDHLLARRSWRGLADPGTRAQWGGLYEMVRCTARHSLFHSHSSLPLHL